MGLQEACNKQLSFSIVSHMEEGEALNGERSRGYVRPFDLFLDFECPALRWNPPEGLPGTSPVGFRVRRMATVGPSRKPLSAQGRRNMLDMCVCVLGVAFASCLFCHGLGGGGQVYLN